MNKITSLEQLRALADQRASERKPVEIYVGAATCGIAAGALEAEEILREEQSAPVRRTGCAGLCYAEPLVEVREKGKPRIWYSEVAPAKAKEIAASIGREPLKDAITESTDLFEGQTRIALRNCGIIDPENINDYIERRGYEALGKALFEMSPADVAAEVKRSGLRGRGGAGFPAGVKWEMTAKAEGDKKYVVCNADEGDPGAFMDRSVLEGDPHSVLEAMAICAYAVGADEGVIYIRAEYPLAVSRLEIAIDQATRLGLLGENIFGTGFRFSLRISLGAGAFVCGEETSLLNSVQGGRGEPRTKPPFPAASGLWNKPTNINNVETYANVCPIIYDGADKFAAIGSEKSKGTKVFALAGKVKNTGLAEVAMGTTLRDVIFKIGKGIQNDKKVKAVQTGGPSGGCIPAEFLDMGIDYESLAGIGSMMGSGGMIVMDEDDCMVDIAKYYLEFTVDESCGRCTPCRIGNRRLLEILEKITNGDGTKEDLAELEKLGEVIKDTSLCGLGQSSPNPVLSTLKYFRDEYEAHIDGKCPSGVCKNLLKFEITDKCIGCTICAKNCPVPCIEGERKTKHRIIQEKCIKCGVCRAKCPVEAIERM